MARLPGFIAVQGRWEPIPFASVTSTLGTERIVASCLASPSPSSKLMPPPAGADQVYRRTSAVFGVAGHHPKRLGRSGRVFVYS